MTISACAFIMPYGKREVAASLVDFDAICENIFRPAINRVRIKRRRLIPRRADDPVHSRDLLFSMIQFVLRSRLALVDLSVPNLTIGGELYARWFKVRSGTILVRLGGHHCGTVRCADGPGARLRAHARRCCRACAQADRSGITGDASSQRDRQSVYEHANLLANSMGTVDKPTKVGILVVDAERCLQDGNIEAANKLYLEATKIAPSLSALHLRYADLLLTMNLAPEANEQLRMAVRIDADAPKEKLDLSLEPQIVVGKAILKTQANEYTDLVDRGIIDPTKVPAPMPWAATWTFRPIVLVRLSLLQSAHPQCWNWPTSTRFMAYSYPC